MITMSERKFRKRTYEQVMSSKEVYKKHALKCKKLGYPEKSAKRMLAYSASLTGMLAEYATKRID